MGGGLEIEKPRTNLFIPKNLFIHKTYSLIHSEKSNHKTKYLELTVNDSLNWNERYKSVKGKVVGGLASLSKVQNILSQSQLLDVYRALVESNLRYAKVVWGALPSARLSTLQRYQNITFNLIESWKIKDI